MEEIQKEHLLDFSPIKSEQTKEKKGIHRKWILKVVGKSFIFWTSCLVLVAAVSHYSDILNSTTQLTLSQTNIINRQKIEFAPLKLSKHSIENAIQTDNFSEFSLLLNKYPEIARGMTEFGISPLALAILYNRSDMVTLLLNNKANPNERSWNSNSLLQLSTIELSEHPTLYYAYRNSYSYSHLLTQQNLIIAGADISYHNYEFVKNNLDSSWIPFWNKYFTDHNNLSLFKSILQERYPEIAKLNSDINNIQNK